MLHLIVAAVAFALRFRLFGEFDDTPEDDKDDEDEDERPEQVESLSDSSDTFSSNSDFSLQSETETSEEDIGKRNIVMPTRGNSRRFCDQVKLNMTVARLTMTHGPVWRLIIAYVLVWLCNKDLMPRETMIVNVAGMDVIVREWSASQTMLRDTCVMNLLLLLSCLLYG